MQMTGYRVIREKVDFEVSLTDVAAALVKEVWARTDRPTMAEYINDKGIWEALDSGPHGSGTTTRFRDATAEEVEIEKALKLIVTVLRKK